MLLIVILQVCRCGMWCRMCGEQHGVLHVAVKVSNSVRRSCVL